MKKTLFFSAICILALAACNNEPKTKEITDTTPLSTPATDTAVATPVTEKPAEKVDSATAMKRWQAYMTPGDAQKQLAAASGKWKVETTSWMEQDKPPMTSTGTAEYKMIMGGRYQQASFKSNMMGMPFEGQSTMAYDNDKKMFISTWIDNMGTGLTTFTGTWDDAAKCYNMKGKMYDPTTQKDFDCREVIKMTDDKNMTMEMYSTMPGGKEFKNMEIKYTKM